MWSQEQMGAESKRIKDALANGDDTYIVASIANSLLRIANAQEAMYELAVRDMNEALEAGIAQRAEERAAELMEERTERSFIGKK